MATSALMEGSSLARAAISARRPQGQSRLATLAGKAALNSRRATGLIGLGPTASSIATLICELSHFAHGKLVPNRSATDARKTSFENAKE